MLKEIARGALAGAAGTTALNAATYVDMAVRARPSSSTPEDTVKAAAAKADVTVPAADQESRDNRVSGLGALSGIATGVCVGAVYGAVRATGLRVHPALASVLVGAVALAGANGPMAALGVSDPREWSATDWIADVVPHLAYGTVTVAAYRD